MNKVIYILSTFLSPLTPMFPICETTATAQNSKLIVRLNQRLGFKSVESSVKYTVDDAISADVLGCLYIFIENEERRK